MCIDFVNNRNSDCVNNPDALSRWLQHFDGIKGCVICVIDMPPVQVLMLNFTFVFTMLIELSQAPEVALWRRLLLGEGDGFSPAAISYSANDDIDSMVIIEISEGVFYLFVVNRMLVSAKGIIYCCDSRIHSSVVLI